MINLIPSPKYCKTFKNDYQVINNLYIVLNSNCSEEDILAARQLKELIKELTGYDSIVEKDEAVDQSEEKILRVLTIAGLLAIRTIFPKVNNLPKIFGEEGYILKTDEYPCIIAKKSAGIFYGVQTLKQLFYKRGKEVYIKSVLIKDFPSFKFRGIMLDVSRGQVPTVKMLKEFIIRYSSLKINMLNLYIEHTFKFKKHPLISRESGGYTVNEIKEIDSFAKKHFVDFVGSFQSFGHQANILKIPKYTNMAETMEKWDLTPARNETYVFLKEIFKEMAPVFSSKYFNINSDETFTLGLGQSKNLVAKIGKGGAYLYHIKKIKNMLDKYKKTVMMWADIVIEHPEILKYIPKDIIMLVWGYGAPISIKRMNLVKESGFEFMACPGTCSSFKLIPEIVTSRTAQRGTVNNAYKSKALGILCTEWGTEMSHDNLFGYDTYGFVHSADISWSKENTSKDWKDFQKRFSMTFFGDKTGKTSMFLEEFGNINNVFVKFVKNNMKNVSNFEWYNINRNLYHESSIPGHLSSQLPDKLISKFANFVKIIDRKINIADKYVTKNRDIWDEYKFSLNMHKFLSEKLRFFSEYRNSGNKDKLKKLIKQLIILKKEHEEYWLKSSKKKGIIYTMKRYEWQINSLTKLLKSTK